MKKIKKETVEYIFDTDLINEALYYIERGYFSRSDEGKHNAREVISRIANDANKILSTLKQETITIDVDIMETESEAREYFGTDFIKQFEEIRQKITEQNASLYIHGTTPEIANIVMQTGLEAKQASVISTAVRQDDYDQNINYNEFSKILNWPHKAYKGLVLIAVLNECVKGEKPIWELRHKDESALARGYAIKPEYIVGIIDVLEKQIIENPTYTGEHSYDSLVLDIDFISRKESKEIDNNENNYSIIEDLSSESSFGKRMEYHIETLIKTYNNILELKDKKIVIIEGNNITDNQIINKYAKFKLLEEFKEGVEGLMKIIPNLKSMEICDKEIDDLICEARISGINKITDWIKEQKHNKKEQSIAFENGEKLQIIWDNKDWD